MAVEEKFMIDGRPITLLTVSELKKELQNRNIKTKPKISKTQLQTKLIKALKGRGSLQENGKPEGQTEFENGTEVSLSEEKPDIMELETFKICVEQIDPNDEDKVRIKLAELDALNDLYLDEELADEIDDENLFYYFADAFKIIEANLFRPLPPVQHDPSFMNVGPAFEMLEDVSDARYQITRANYYLLYNVLLFENKHGLDCSAFIDSIFVTKFLSFIKSEIKEERIIVSNILEIIYTRFPDKQTQIRELVTQYCIEVITFKSKFHIYCSDLLSLVWMILCESESSSQAEWDAFYRLLLLMHSLSYTYYFYIPLFACCRHLLSKSTQNIAQFTQTILNRCKQKSLKPSSNQLPVNDTSSKMLCIIEIEMIFDILIELEDAEEAASIFAQIIKPILVHLGEVLKSLNSQLVESVIAMLTPDVVPLFEPHWKLVAQVWLPILSCQDYQLTWDQHCFVQQINLLRFLSFYDSPPPPTLGV